MTYLKSPFPGMDPYLEQPSEWPSLHLNLLAAFLNVIAAALPDGFYVRVDQRVYMTSPGDEDRDAIEPDVYVAKEAQAVYAPAITQPVLVDRPDLDPLIHDRFLEIRDTRSRKVITIIELLSPFNKRSQAQGFQAFRRKRTRVMASACNWIEIDLLRAGLRPREVEGRSDYYALLKRGDRLGPYEVWFFNLRQPMPTIAVPLIEPHADIPLDLQRIFEDVYTRTRYANSVDYTARLSDLPPQDQSWANEQISVWQVVRSETEQAT
jgi:hypothetical protein